MTFVRRASDGKYGVVVLMTGAGTVQARFPGSGTSVLTKGEFEYVDPGEIVVKDVMER